MSSVNPNDMTGMVDLKSYERGMVHIEQSPPRTFSESQVTAIFDELEKKKRGLLGSQDSVSGEWFHEEAVPMSDILALRKHILGE